MIFRTEVTIPCFLSMFGYIILELETIDSC